MIDVRLNDWKGSFIIIVTSKQRNKQIDENVTIKKEMIVKYSISVTVITVAKSSFRHTLLHLMEINSLGICI